MSRRPRGTSPKCLQCNRNSLLASYARGLCYLCYNERDLTPEQRAERAERRREKMFQRVATVARLPYTATVAERTAVIVYRTAALRCDDDDESYFTESNEVLEAGTKIRFSQIHEGFFHAETNDGGRFLIGVDFVTVTMRRAGQATQQHSDNDDDDQGDDNHNTQHDEGGDDGSIAGLDDRTRGEDYPVRTTAETTESDIVRTD